MRGRGTWGSLPPESAARYARVALDNIEREFPAGVHHQMTARGDFPVRPRARNPAFYGSYDWHSCVEMHWVLVRLLRAAAGDVPAERVRAALDAHLSADALAAEAAFIAEPYNASQQRPYGWGWALALAHEVATWDDPDARRWAEGLAPLADAVVDLFLDWLPKATYPIRHGVHANSAFGLSRALPFAAERASAGDPSLHDAIAACARSWFGEDLDYPAGYEPSGADFLSPALTEAELMGRLLPRDELAAWLTGFLPGLATGQPTALFTPAVVSDSSDGYIAHLYGLNLSRAWCLRRLAALLPPGDPRGDVADAAARRHADAALPHVVGDDYMVEHWLACYAVLLLT